MGVVVAVWWSTGDTAAVCTIFLQFLAWNSPPLIAEFVDILPFLLDAGTAIEIFHLLLDLPCLTAALDVQMR